MSVSVFFLHALVVNLMSSFKTLNLYHLRPFFTLFLGIVMMPGMPMNAPPGVYTPTNGIINVTMFLCPYFTIYSTLILKMDDTLFI